METPSYNGLCSPTICCYQYSMLLLQEVNIKKKIAFILNNKIINHK